VAAGLRFDSGFDRWARAVRALSLVAQPIRAADASRRLEVTHLLGTRHIGVIRACHPSRVTPERPDRRASRERRHSLPVLNPFPSIDEIAERAHILWIADGRRPDRIVPCWRQAEDELLDRAARRTVG